MKQLSLFEAPEVVVMPPSQNGQLRDYQVDVLDRGRGHMRAGRKRGIIQIETGGGKTFVEAEMARCCVQKNMRCLILADRRKLVKQIGKALDTFGVPYGVVMADDTRHTHLPVITASRDTLNAWSYRKLPLPDRPDLILIDECHKAEGAVYQELLNLWSQSYLVGLTATPARGDGKRLDNTFQWLECAVPSSELIRRGWLVRTVVKWPRELALARKRGKKRKAGLCGDPVAHWRMHADGLATIGFAGTVASSIDLRDRFLAAGIPAEHVDAQTPDSERERCYERLKNRETLVLCSVGLLIEGIDIAEVSAAIIWKRFGSIVEWRQACGRPMRPAPWIGKTKAVILDHSGASGEHGAPGEDIEWSLDADSTVQSRRRQRQPNAPPSIVCRRCGTYYSGKAVCPDCGEPAPSPRKTAMQKLVESRDEVLSDYESGDSAKEWALKEANEKIFQRCVYRAIHQNGTFKMVAAIFRKQVGCWPNDAGIECPNDWSMKARELFPDHARVAGKAKK